MSTITVAQALATSANGLLVADTAANIANNLSNPSLVSRVTQFYMNGNDAVAAWQAAALAAIGNKFSLNSYYADGTRHRRPAHRRGQCRGAHDQRHPRGGE